MFLGFGYKAKGLSREALAELQKARELNDDPYVLSYLGRVYAAFGKRDEAMNILGQMNEATRHRYVAAYSFAIVHAGLGDKDQAFHWSERSYQDRAYDITNLKVDPFLDSLRSDPRSPIWCGASACKTESPTK